nr:uncharacterized mitochondrial protein AtMg00810-like [Tanacetum cinerariifolium]
MAFFSSPGSTNEVYTASIQISAVCTPVSTISSPDNTANLSDATVYAFVANQPNGSQLVHEYLEQIHEDDLEEMDLKWQLALLSMRARRNFAPTAVLTKSGIVPISTARQSSSRAATPVSAVRSINTAGSKPLVNVAKPRSNVFQKSHSLSRRFFYQQTTLKKRNLNNNVNTTKANSVNTAKVNSVNTAKGNKVTSVVRNQGLNTVKSSDAPQDALKDQRYFDSGCSKHMTGNISYLIDFKEHGGGYVAFRGGAKGGKITGKGTWVAERRNKILIEAARTMLADTKLPTTFWAEVVSTACYVQNRVLVAKPHFKTPYELFKGGGPKWLFNLDALSKSMNYAPVSTGIPVSPIPSTRIHKDHFKEHIIGEMEPKKVTQALDDESWVEAMQEEILQFKLLNVWTLVYVSQPPGFVEPEFPYRVYKVEKALYGLHQAPKAWYETLSTYLLDNRFRKRTIDKTLFIKKIKDGIVLVQIYVDDIIFVSTKRSLSTEFEQLMHNRFQISSMRELTFFLGLQVEQRKDGIFLSQEKYVSVILKKFGFSSVKSASTPMKTHKPLSKDANGTDVDVHLYRFQVQPKVSHMHAVNRIFKYLKGQPTLGLWFPKDSPLKLIAYSDSDYASASLDRKFTTGGCQFLGSRLISWQCQKQTIMANSTTEAEYIAASNCCGQVTDTIKRDKIQAKPNKTEHKTESVEKSIVKGQQKVKPDKIKAKETKKSKGNKVEGLNLPLCKVYKEKG